MSQNNNSVSGTGKKGKKAAVIIIVVILILAAAFAALYFTGVIDDILPCIKNETGTEEPAFPAVPTSKYARENDPVATITLSDGNVVVVRLYPEAAPNTVANFVTLAASGFYDGVAVTRVIPGMAVQTGDPLGIGLGGPGYFIKGEFAENGVKNYIAHKRGIVSMFRFDQFDSAGSQFNLMLGDAPHMDGLYAAFGEVTEGIEFIDAIAAAEINESGMPVEQIVLESVTVDTKGVEYNVEKMGVSNDGE